MHIIIIPPYRYYITFSVLNELNDITIISAINVLCVDLASLWCAANATFTFWPHALSHGAAGLHSGVIPCRLDWPRGCCEWLQLKLTPSVLDEASPKCSPVVRCGWDAAWFSGVV